MISTLYVIAGPTASGKSDLAIRLAKHLSLEVISADSRQIYKGLDIGSGKVTKEEMQGVVHHMLSCYTPGITKSVAEYQKDCLPILEHLMTERGGAIICGGTGQYIDSLIYTTQFPKAPPNPLFRETLAKLTTEELFERLKSKDLRRAATIDRHNRRRLERALEIIESLGYVPQSSEKELRFPTKIFHVDPEINLLRERIAARLASRIESGLIEEVHELLRNGASVDWLVSLGLEYKYITEMIVYSKSIREVQSTLQHAINHYARRQRVWNKKFLRDAIRLTVSQDELSLSHPYSDIIFDKLCEHLIR